MKNVKVFRDTRRPLCDYEDEVVGVCPRCKNRARIFGPLVLNEETRVIDRVRTLFCTACGLSRDRVGPKLPHVDEASYGDDLKLDLWLQTPCGGRTLWALNLGHLETLESFVRADLREQHPDPRYPWKRSSFINRLPDWIKTANHRDYVLKAVARLQRQLGRGARR